MLLFSVSFFLAYMMLLWFKTNAFVEYCNLFRVTRFLFVDEYNKLHAEGYGELFVDFLHEYYKDFFFIRLITCPLCLSFWLGALASVFLAYPAILLLSPLILFFYLVFNRML